VSSSGEWRSDGGAACIEIAQPERPECRSDALADGEGDNPCSSEASSRSAVAVSAATVAASLGHADPPVCPADASSCPAADQKLIADMTAVGIDQDPVHQSQGGLISGARNTVCPGLDGGEAEDTIADKLEKYSGFNALQAST
jgi:hypothetical protein